MTDEQELNFCDCGYSDLPDKHEHNPDCAVLIIQTLEHAARREGMKEALRWVMDHRARFSDYGLIEKFHEALRRVEEGGEL